MTSAAPTYGAGRRADIDSLRVCALLLLIVYHTLLVFNSWDWWRVKSEYAGYWADYITGILTPWRMSLVFFVGGVAARFMMERSKAGEFVMERAGKLLTAFFFALVVLVPLQRYVRLDEAGTQPHNYFEYVLHQARYVVSYHGVWLPDFAHVWFLPYLFMYSALGAAIFHFLPRTFAFAQKVVDGAPAWAIIAATMLWFSFVEVKVLPQNPVSGLLFPDVGAHVKFAPLFFLGLLLGKSEVFTQKLLRIRVPLWATALALFAVSFVLQWTEMGLNPPKDAYSFDWFAMRGLYGGAMLFSFVAFGAAVLNKPSKLLTYATDAILPIYLMHQTVLVVIADKIVGHGWPLAAEMITLFTATALIPLAIYHFIVRPIPWLRVLFGLRPHARDLKPKPQPEGIVGLPLPR